MTSKRPAITRDAMEVKQATAVRVRDMSYPGNPVGFLVSWNGPYSPDNRLYWRAEAHAEAFAESLRTGKPLAELGWEWTTENCMDPAGGSVRHSLRRFSGNT